MFGTTLSLFGVNTVLKRKELAEEYSVHGDLQPHSYKLPNPTLYL